MEIMEIVEISTISVISIVPNGNEKVHLYSKIIKGVYNEDHLLVRYKATACSVRSAACSLTQLTVRAEDWAGDDFITPPSASANTPGAFPLPHHPYHHIEDYHDQNRSNLCESIHR